MQILVSLALISSSPINIELTWLHLLIVFCSRGTCTVLIDHWKYHGRACFEHSLYPLSKRFILFTLVYLYRVILFYYFVLYSFRFLKKIFQRIYNVEYKGSTNNFVLTVTWSFDRSTIRFRSYIDTLSVWQYPNCRHVNNLSE